MTLELNTSMVCCPEEVCPPAAPTRTSRGQWFLYDDGTFGVSLGGRLVAFGPDGQLLPRGAPIDLDRRVLVWRVEACGEIANRVRAILVRLAAGLDVPA